MSGANEITFLWSHGGGGASTGGRATAGGQSGGTLIFSHDGIAVCGSNGCAGPVRPFSEVQGWEFVEAEQVVQLLFV
jgi:hypothetical protein